MIKFVSPASFWIPTTLVSSAWIEHAPFAFWLIDVHRPRTIVELGTHHGYSFLVFDQAISTLQLDTRCFAIDTWRGDEQTGFYGEEVFETLCARHDKLYSGFSQLVRSTFEEAVRRFDDGSIDLLHIDGRHRYEDAYEDFHTWKGKLSDRAVVLLHDTRVSDPGFGVAKLWEELCKEYPHFELVHGHGLGVLGAGKNQSRDLTELFATDDASAKEVQDTYRSLGAKITDLMRLRAAEDDAASLRSQVARCEADLANCRAEADEWKSQAEQARKQTATSSAELGQLKSSTERLKLQLSHEVAQKQVLESRLGDSEREEGRSSYGYNGRGFGLPRRLINPFPLVRDMALVARSGMFQRGWYLAHNADVAKAGVHPLIHYLRHGAREGRDPSPHFDTTWYLRQNPDVAKSGINPLVHYLRRGKREGRMALPEESNVATHPAECELSQPAAARTSPHRAMRDDTRMERLLNILRCPQTHERLRAIRSELVTESGSMRWPIIAGRPVLTPAGASVVVHPDAHLSNELAESATKIIKETDGLVLNLSAGGTAARHENVIEMEYSIFRHTDVVGDVHSLPFIDEAFEAVVCLNAFEHYREPELALAEIRRVLKPGGRLLLHTAFLQPLHEAPHHYFNCTKFGLLHWLRDFQVETVRVSDNFNPAYAISWIASELEEAIEKGVSAAAQGEFRQMRISEFVEFWRDPSTRNAARWRKFRDIPPNSQEKLAAGWEAIVRKH